MTALVTPLTEDGQLDVPALESLIDFQIDNGIEGLLVLGGTGEYAALTAEVRADAVRETVRYTNHRVPVIAGVLEPGIGEALKFAKVCEENGADAILLLNPFYIMPPQDGIVDYFKRIGRAIDLPILIYNIPYRTMVNILPATVEQIVDEVPSVVGMKECATSLGQAIEVIQRVGDRISVLSGEEFLMGAEILFGAKGAIMASANLIPEVWVRMYKYASESKAEELRAEMKRYYPLIKLLFQEMNPGPIKYAMNLAGHKVGPVSSPLHEPAEELKRKLKEEMGRLGII